ncbi:hypothetical protein Xen7305DRAFT_00008570 [Xenococcus sp. PCC 7305]|uniref:hypothetical protein n=1 Tax=Xenococcus sp. PCC 7305 TaxID=102125 RepID=UPI0002AC528E|nr:hypothetical protein [Xenococcus sp. PCC 7305]ELS01155.1 hypothetical protein Xen7305DRAFT_00008570 [Xenococcus sp. PCC 7305]
MPIAPGKTYVEETIAKEASCVLNLVEVTEPDRPPSYKYWVRSYLENRTLIGESMADKEKAIAQGRQAFKQVVADAKHIEEILKVGSRE